MTVNRAHLLWGVDDWLGDYRDFLDDAVPPTLRVGSRLCISPKCVPLKPRAVGFIGNPVRSIVDVGAAYLVMTEAKRRSVAPSPQICLCSKLEPHTTAQLFTVSSFLGQGTGFTYSRASIAAKDGVFFSYRASGDVFPAGARILRWRILFD